MDRGLENIMRGFEEARKEMWEKRLEEMVEEARKNDKKLPTVIIGTFRPDLQTEKN